MDNHLPEPLAARGISTPSSAEHAVEHREFILGGLATLMSFYWQPDDVDHRVSRAAGKAWADDLERFPRSVISAAFDHWRQSETRRPTPSDMIRLCLARIPRPRPVLLPERRAPSDVDRERRRALVAELSSQSGLPLAMGRCRPAASTHNQERGNWCRIRPVP